MSSILPCLVLVLLMPVGALFAAAPVDETGLATAERELRRSGVLVLPGQDGLRLEGSEPGAATSLVGVLPATADDAIAREWVVLAMRVSNEFVPGGGIGRIVTGLSGKSLRRDILLALLPQGRGVPREVEAALPLQSIAAWIDLDLGPGKGDDSLALRGLASSTVWPGLIERTNVVVGLDVRAEDDLAPDSSAAALHAHGVPALQISTAGADDPTIRFVTLLVRKLGNLDRRPVASDPDSRPVPRQRSVFTGTVPAYSAEGDGLLLDNVIPGGPAEAAGLRAGDRIIEFGGREIKDVNDYAAALDEARVGVPIRVVFLRDDRRTEATITPAERK